MEKIDVLINEKDLQKRIESLAEQIMKDYKDEEIVFIGVLKGSVVFMVDLAKKIKNDVLFEFIQIESYSGEQSTGKIKLKQDLTGKIEGKNVIIVEDIIDTGLTMRYLLDYMKKFNPKSLKVCTLLDKPSRRTVEVPIDYIGFQIENEFVLGYGLDYDQKYRNLPYIGKWRKDV